jgi:hypothetical protein
VTGLQVPATTSQAWHCPPQAELQHTPSTQKPDWHWSPAPQVWPIVFCALQVPLAQ